VATLAVVALASLQFAVDIHSANGEQEETLSPRKFRAFLVVFAVATGLVVLLLTLNRGQISVVATCPGASTASAFQGVIGSPLPGPAAVRTGAGIGSSFRILRRYPSGCPLGFKGYCLGQPVPDFRSPSLPDGRWFFLDGESGFIASAVIDGDPPPSMEPGSCPGSVPPPSHVQLVAPQRARITSIATFVVRATNAPYVSLVAWYPDTPDASSTPYRWHQIGVVTDPRGGIVRWDTRPVPGVRVVVAAVACLAVNFPSSATTTRRYTITPLATRPLRRVPRPSLAVAISIACRTTS